MDVSNSGRKLEHSLPGMWQNSQINSIKYGNSEKQMNKLDIPGQTLSTKLYK